MNNINRELAQKMDRRDILYGTVLNIGAPIVTELLAQSGFDILWLDMEHTAIGVEAVLNNLIAARSGGAAAWVRVPWNDPVLVKPIMDMGADGIIFPFIRTVDEAKLAAAACTYPPHGIRGFGPYRAADYGRISLEEYVGGKARDCRRIIQIEHIDAVRNLREIAAIEGIDGFIVGPCDLSASIGKLGQLRCDEMLALYQEIGQVLREAGKPSGIYAGNYNKEYIQQFIDMGFTMFFNSSDYTLLYQSATDMIRNFRENFC